MLKYSYISSRQFSVPCQQYHTNEHYINFAQKKQLTNNYMNKSVITSNKKNNKTTSCLHVYER